MPRSQSDVSVSLLLVTVLAVAFGAFARLHDLDRMVVWHDEVFSLLRTFGFDGDAVRLAVFDGRDLAPRDLLSYQEPSPQLGLGDTLASLATHPEHSPLFFLAARLATPAFSSPLEGVRGTSAVLSLLLVPAIFWLAWELFQDATSAWVAAALAATSPMHLLYAQEARQYALWTLVAAAASAALLRALARDRGRDWVLYGVLVTIGLYTHLLFAVLLAVHGAYLLLTPHRGAKANLRAPAGRWATTVAAATVLFSPWIAVALSGVERVREVTAWMERPVPAGRLLEAWATNLVRVFADFPAAGPFLLLGLIPLVWMLWRFCAHGPLSARLFTCALFLGFATLVLVPDLTLGGSRSLHPRYVLPAFLALELAAAYLLAAAWRESSTLRRRAGQAVFLSILALGVWSSVLILRADTWWNKNFSADNRAVAALINASEEALVLASDSGVGLGEAISLAYDLDGGVVLRGEPQGSGIVSTRGGEDIFLLTPSAELRTALAADYRLVPVLGTWQWYRAVPGSQGVEP